MSDDWFDPITPQPFTPPPRDYSGFDFSDMAPDTTPLGDDGWPDISTLPSNGAPELSRIDDLYRLDAVPAAPALNSDTAQLFHDAPAPKRAAKAPKQPRAKKVKEGGSSAISNIMSSNGVVEIKPIPLLVGAVGVVLTFLASSMFWFNTLDSILKWPLMLGVLIMGYLLTQKKGVVTGAIGVIMTVMMVFLLKWTVLLVPILIVGVLIAYLFLDRD